jgi:hypothetical protein
MIPNEISWVFGKVRMSKYKANPLYYQSSTQQVILAKDAKEIDKNSLLYFPSRHEFAVYKILLSLTDKYILKRHQDIEIIKPKTTLVHPKGKCWQADFTLSNTDLSLQTIVEAKGAITRDFPLILALLELNNKELFDKIWLVFPSQVPASNQVIRNLQKTPMKNRIVTLAEFKQHIYIHSMATRLL